MRYRLVGCALLSVLAAAGEARAVELFGVTPSAGAVGDGRLTANITLEGTVDCLRWPNATFYEHVKHKTAGWDPDPAQNGWLKPYYGANANSGAFAGIRYTDGTQSVMRWLREGNPQFRYASSTSNRLVGTYTFATTYGTDIVVEESTFNVPDKPALIRTYRLVQAPGELTNFAVIAFMNPALRTEHGKYSPWDDTQKDDEPRFGAFYDPSVAAILTAEPWRVGTALRAKAPTALGADLNGIRAFLEDVEGDWSDGVYLLQGASVNLTGFQVGTDATLSDSGPQDAAVDATDGTLSRNTAVLNYETTALSFGLSKTAPAAWYLVFATRPAAARKALEELRTRTPAEWIQESDAWWSDWLRDTVLPAGELEKVFARRALISLRTGYDPESGAIVASTSCEPPYNVDWPRDGAFFQFVLDLNGKHEEAGKHARFYPHIQNKTKRLLGPAGSFPMNAFADYVPGGPIDFEIDQIGFVLWLYRTHASYLSPADAWAFFEDIRESAGLAADLLVSCKDDNGLQCPANEDDHPEMTQTAHGAITAWLGLVSAAELFEAMGEPRPAYRERARELAAAIRKHFTPGGKDGKGISGGQLGWAVWPANFWTAQDGNEALIHSVLTEDVQGRVLDPEAESTSYQTKETIALLMPLVRTASTERFADEVHAKFLGEIANRRTLHLGELTSHVDLDGDGEKEWVNRVATPHIWAQALLYLSLLAREDPARLAARPIVNMQRYRDSLRLDGARDRKGGCDCKTGGGADPWALAPAAVVLGVLFWRRKLRKNP